MTHLEAQEWCPEKDAKGEQVPRCTLLEDLFQLPAIQVGDHRCCNLAKWLSQVGGEFSQFGRLDEIQWRHEPVHALALEIVFKKMGGKPWTLLQSMQRFKELWRELNEEVERKYHATNGRLGV